MKNPRAVWYGGFLEEERRRGGRGGRKREGDKEIRRVGE
jgi:hypothetical protein